MNCVSLICVHQLTAVFKIMCFKTIFKAYGTFFKIMTLLNLFLVVGCPVKLPRLDEIVDKLDCLSTKERQILCDSVFLTINWFREVRFAMYECASFLPFSK